MSEDILMNREQDTEEQKVKHHGTLEYLKMKVKGCQFKASAVKDIKHGWRRGWARTAGEG